MSKYDLTEGFRTDPVGGIAAPPFTSPKYKFNSDIAYMGNVRNMPHRYYLDEFFSHTPGINADLDNATEATRVPRNKHFEVDGTNATSDLATFDDITAGIRLTTAGADNDQMIVKPHLDTKQTAWAQLKWGTENQTIWECMISTGAAITTVLYWAGLKLTNTPTVVTDDDQAFFRFSTDDSDTNWKIVYSIDGTDKSVDSGVAVAVNTQYRFRIEIDSSRKAHFYINDNEIEVSTALTDDVDLIPYVGIQALSAAARYIKLHYQKMSRIIFE